MFTLKMQTLPVTAEAKVFYLSICLCQAEIVDAQLSMGVDPPKIRLNCSYIDDYGLINELTERDMILIVEEL